MSEIRGLEREEKRKVTLRMGENDIKFDFVLIKKEHRQFIRKVKAITGDFHNELVIVDINKTKTRKVVKKKCADRRNISLMKAVRMRK